MRVLWICNIMLPRVAKQRNPQAVPADGGWLTGLSEAMLTQKDVELAVAFPIYGLGELEEGEALGLKYFAFTSDLKKLSQYNRRTEEQIREIIRRFEPDVMEIFGTEYPHSLAAVRAFARPERTCIHIQGLMTYYARHFMANLPERVQKGFTFRDLIRWDNLKIQQKKFIKRSLFEKQAMEGVHHILGRTDWDRACGGELNPNAKYHFNNESLRDSFYENRWNFEDCEKFSIFVSQGSYPIKGFHFLLQALPEIIRHFPDTHVYVAGGNVVGEEGLKASLRVSSYGKYLKELIREGNLESRITFTGFLDEKRMCEQYLKAHVFVSPSSIENSPNSVGEAMLLGVPVVSSDVGGVKCMMRHGVDGLLYQADAPYMLAYSVCQVFGNPGLARNLSLNGRERAQKTHDRERNVKVLKDIYEEIRKS